MLGRIAFLTLVLVLFSVGAGAAPRADRMVALRRGVNLTNWFRYPPSTAPAALNGYLSDAAMDDLRRAGLTFVRLAVQPELLSDVQPILLDQAARLQRHGLAVVVSLHPVSWHLDTDPADRARLVATWRALALALARFDPRLTFPEVLNEPVFAGTPAAWQALQHAVLREIRAALPVATVVLTGANWGSVAGLLALPPESDPNVVYSVHLYDPAELTSLAAWRPGLDRAALALLPFPAGDPGACERAAGPTDPETRGVVRFYCAMHWDAPRVAAPIDAAAAWAARNHAAVLLGEFGATARLNPAARLVWLAAVRTACERHGIGWALWGYDDAMGFGVTRPPGSRPVLDPGVRRALGLVTPTD
jgi:hypothetical protein